MQGSKFYLSKSDFQLASSCAQKLVYKKKGYDSSNDTDEDEMRYGGLKRRRRTTTNPMAGINRLMLPNEQYHTPKGRLFVPPHFQSGGMQRFEDGGTVADLWEEHTGTPWSEAKKQGLTDGSYESNMKVRDMLLKSEIKK